MAIGFNNTSDPRAVAQNQRGLIQQQGDILNQQNKDLGNQATAQTQGYQGFLDPIEQQMASGQGGYSPEEAASIEGNTGQYGLNGLPTSQQDLQSNFLSPDEQAGMLGNTGSYTDYFDPNGMQDRLTASQGTQNQAVNGLQSKLNSSIDPNQLKQSQSYLDDTNHQLKNNSNQFGTVLNSVGKNVRGSIDPNALVQDKNAAQIEVMTPEDQQRIVTGAGISAGVANQAAVGALERQSRAAGTSPLGVAAYRARMNQANAIAGADAMTKARVQAQEARASEQLSSEQQREGAQQYLTGTQVGAEQQIGQEALAGTQQLGQQALTQQNTQEAQRTADEQYLTGANLQAATTGGEAALQNAQTMTGQNQQQGQYAANTGTGIRQAQDTANSARAGQVATNRQGTGEGNQSTAFNQGMTVNNAQSGRAATVANQRLGQQNTGLALQSGQEQLTNSNAQGAYGRQQQNYATQSGATNQAANTQEAASQNPGIFDKILGAATGVAAGAASGAASAGYLDEGGIATPDNPKLAVIAEHGPEAVVPMGNAYRARMSRPAPPKPKKFGRRVYGEAA